MRNKTRVLIGVVGVGLATLIATPAAGANGASVVCDLLAEASPAQVSCTVAGPEGSEFMLVLAATDEKGSEEITSSSRRSSGNTVTFTQLVPEGAARLVATAVVDGSVVDSAVIAVPPGSPADSVALGLRAITVALAAVVALVLGAVILYVDARKRAVDRRRAGAYQGVSP